MKTEGEDRDGREGAAGRAANRPGHIVTLSTKTQHGVRLLEAYVHEAARESASRGFSVLVSNVHRDEHFDLGRYADAVIKVDNNVQFVIECKHSDASNRPSLARWFRDWAVATDPNRMQVTAVGQAIERSIGNLGTPSSQGRRRALDRARAVLRKLTSVRVAEGG